MPRSAISSSAAKNPYPTLAESVWWWGAGTVEARVRIVRRIVGGRAQGALVASSEVTRGPGTPPRSRGVLRPMGCAAPRRRNGASHEMGAGGNYLGVDRLRWRSSRRAGFKFKRGRRDHPGLISRPMDARPLRRGASVSASPARHRENPRAAAPEAASSPIWSPRARSHVPSRRNMPSTYDADRHGQGPVRSSGRRRAPYRGGTLRPLRSPIKPPPYRRVP